MSLDPNTIIATSVGAATGIFALFKGLDEYRKGRDQKRQEIEIKNQELVQKRQEILFPLIKEFDESSSLKFAKMILDDLIVVPENVTFTFRGQDFSGQSRMAKDFLYRKPNTEWIKLVGQLSTQGNKLEIRESGHSLVLIYDPSKAIQVVEIDDKRYTFVVRSIDTQTNLTWCYHRTTLDQILRNHIISPILDEGENVIRQSFDALLDFFGKLGYLLFIGLIKKDELLYFQYYLKEMVSPYHDSHDPAHPKENPVISYSKTYGFVLFALLLKGTDLLPDSLRPLLSTLQMRE